MTLEIGHVLFIDIVDYSKLLIHEQTEQLETLRRVARSTETFQAAEAKGNLMRLPTGDGGALVFRTSPEEPVQCAVQISQALKNHPSLRVRMGVHSGPVAQVLDLNEQANIAGAGINVAQRVMNCGDAGHILLSKRVADDLEQYARWRPLLHDLGNCEVKHGVTLTLINLYSDQFGNPDCPRKLEPVAAAHPKTEAEKPISRKSIAVLPFDNLSADAANTYFADGIQEEILTRLSCIRDLKVISRTSTQRFRGATENIRDIARQLGVANILEGSVRKAANRVRVHVQLIDAQTDDHLWAERYDRDLTDIFEVESDIAATIAETLEAKLTGAERKAIAFRPTTNSEAHELYLQGCHYWRNFYAPGYERVRECFEKAIAIDPTYALAHCGLGLYYSFAGANAIFRPEESWPAAEKALNTSIALDPDLADPYNPLAGIEIYFRRDWPAAERAFHRGLELNPNFSDIYHHYGLLLAMFGRGEESLRSINRAAELDPFFPGGNLHRGRIFFFLRDYDAAIAQFAKTINLFPGYAAAHEYYGDALHEKGMKHEAMTQWRAALMFSGATEQAQTLESVFHRDGYEAALRAMASEQVKSLDAKIAQGHYVPASSYVFAYIRAGDLDQAFTWLPKMAEQRDWFPLQLRANPQFDPMRDDPRFQKAVASVFRGIL